MKFIVHAVAIVAAAWFCVWSFGQGIVCVGQSMQPTMDPGQTVVVNRIVYKFSDPQRYDVIAFTDDETDAYSLDDMEDDEASPSLSIKRVIGLPGEKVQISDGRIYINGKALEGHDDLDKVSLPGIASEPLQLGDDEYFVLGDNRKASEDSRYEKIGNIKSNRILGKVWYRILPFKQAGKIE